MKAPVALGSVVDDYGEEVADSGIVERGGCG